MKPYFDVAGITIYHGDCMDVMPSLPDEHVDIAVTSPPYNMALSPGGNGRGMYLQSRAGKGERFRDGYGLHNDAMPRDEYDGWQRTCLAEIWRVVKAGIFYNNRSRIEHGVLHLPLDLNFGLPLKQWIVWDRGTGIDVNVRHFCTRHELIFVFAKPDFALVDHSASGMGDVWNIGMGRDEPGHPATFPESLPNRCITATGARSVIDPFMGSGTTLIAAQRLGVRAIGIETTERFCEMAATRLAQQPLFGTTS